MELQVSPHSTSLAIESLCLDPKEHDRKLRMSMFMLESNHLFQVAGRYLGDPKVQKILKDHPRKPKGDDQTMMNLFTLIMELDRADHDSTYAKLLKNLK